MKSSSFSTPRAVGRDPLPAAATRPPFDIETMEPLDVPPQWGWSDEIEPPPEDWWRGDGQPDGRRPNSPSTMGKSWFSTEQTRFPPTNGPSTGRTERGGSTHTGRSPADFSDRNRAGAAPVCPRVAESRPNPPPIGSRTRQRLDGSKNLRSDFSKRGPLTPFLPPYPLQPRPPDAAGGTGHTPSNPDRQTPREERVEKGNS